MPTQLLRTASQGLTNCEWGKIMIAGNPTSHDGALYHAVNVESNRWTVIRITGDPDDPKRSPRIDIEEARLNIQQYGRTNPWVMSFILGLFPPTSVNTLLGPDDVYARSSAGSPTHTYANIQKRIGVDVARFGDDRTILFPRQGRRAFNPVEMRNARGPDIAGRRIAGRKSRGARRSSSSTRRAAGPAVSSTRRCSPAFRSMS
jgi:phage terminase large subunit